MKKSVLGWFAVAASLGAQSARLDGPTVGHLFHEPSNSIRPIQGVPGAAYLGAPVLTGVSRASIAPNGKAALVWREDRLWLALLPESGLLAIETTREPDRIEWSPNSRAAVLYHSPTSSFERIQIGGRAGYTLVLPEFLEGTVTALAISPSGEEIVAGIQGAGLYLLHADEQPRLLLPMADPLAAAFDESGQRLFAADRVTRRVVEIRDPAGIGAVAASHPIALDDPVYLAVSGRFLYVASPSRRTAQIYDTGTRQPVEEISLDFVPAVLERLSEQPVYLLRTPRTANEPAWLLDGRSLSVYFVPAVEEHPSE